MQKDVLVILKVRPWDHNTVWVIVDPESDQMEKFLAPSIDDARKMAAQFIADHYATKCIPVYRVE
jgi:hypothetical protein